MKRIAALITAIALALVFCGCHMVSQSGNRLLKAPKDDAAAKNIEKALSRTINGDYTLKSPRTGINKTSCTFNDVDSDGTEEAILFYSVKRSNEVMLYMAVLSQKEGNWKVTGTIGFSGTDVDRLEFCDVNNDGIFEMTVSWYVYSNIEKRVSVIKMIDLEPVSIFEESYAQYAVYDIDKDSNDELLLFVIDAAQKKNYCDMYAYSSGQMKREQNIKLDGNAKKINSLYKTTVDSLPGVILDAEDYKGTYYSEIIVSKNGKLAAPVYEQSGQSSLITRRYQDIKCSDVSGDGSLEIPCMTVLPKDNTKGEDMYLTEWKNYKNNKFQTVAYSVISSGVDYKINIDKSWIGNFTCLKYGDDGMVFYGYTNTSGIGGELFRVCKVPLSEYDKDKYKGYFVLEENNSSVYLAAVKKNNNSKILVSQNVVEKIFASSVEGRTR